MDLDQGTVRAPAFLSSLLSRIPRIARRYPAYEHALAICLGLLVLAVHDVGNLLGRSYWVDETWVAVTTRFPLSDLPTIGSSTPIGWSVALRLVTTGRSQTSRLLPLAFAGAAVVVAYWLARGLAWRRRDVAVVAGILAAAAVLLVPAMLVRDDLKQYTADACMALLTLAVTARLERNWSRRGLAALSAAVCGGMLFSHTVAFVGVAAFGAVCAVQLARREWTRLVEATLAGAGTAVLMAVVYVAFDARAANTALVGYWRGYFVPLNEGAAASERFVADRLAAVPASAGLGPGWLETLLFLAGVVTLFRLGRPATALAVTAVWPEMLAAAALKKYPFLDQRTSTFLFVLTAAVAAIGVAGLCAYLRPRLNGALTASLAVAAVVAFAVHVQPVPRAETIPVEDIGPQTRFVAAHAAPDDVILVNLPGNWGFAYYWTVGKPSRRATAAVIPGYEAYWPDQPRIVVARDRTEAGIDQALGEALSRMPHRAGARLWLVRIHMLPTEQEAWRVALRRRGVAATPTGRHGLSVIRVTRPQRGPRTL